MLRLKSLSILGIMAAWALSTSASAQYPAKGIRLLSNVPLSSFSGAPADGSAIITYTSPSGREYAIMGATNGKHFFDITDPASPVAVGFIPTPAGSLWQEMCVVGQYCYGVSEHSATQVIDMTQIDAGIVSLVGTWSHTWTDPATSTNITLQGRAHTAQGNNASQTVYVNGARDFNSPAQYYMVALDVSVPTAPTVAGYWSMFDIDSKNSSKIVYVHDCTVVNYDSGPWAGKEIVFAMCGYDGLYILDATDKANITLLSKNTYLPANTYAHSGSLSPDKKYYYANDEFDEAYGGSSNTTHIFNVEDLTNPVYVGADSHGNNFIDHNSIMQDGKLLVSSYAGGLRVFDYTNPVDITEVGHFDTLPAIDYKDYVANWGVAGELASGTVVLSDMQAGLFVLDVSEAVGLGAVPIANVFAKGFIGGGTFNDSRRSDDRTLRYQGTNLGLDATLTVQSTIGSYAGGGSLTLEARGANSPGALTVQVYNRTTSSWEKLGRYALGASDLTFTTVIPNMAHYFDGNGNAELRFTLPKKSRTAPGNPGVLFDRICFKVG